MRAWKNEPARTVGGSRVRLRGMTYGAARIIRANGEVEELVADPQAGEELAAAELGVEWASRLYGRELKIAEVVFRIVPWSRVLDFTRRTAFVLEERELFEDEVVTDEETLRRHDGDSEDWSLVPPEAVDGLLARYVEAGEKEAAR